MNDNQRDFTKAEAAALLGRVVRDDAAGALGKLTGIVEAADGDRVSKMKCEWLTQTRVGVVRHENQLSYHHLASGEYQLPQGMEHAMARADWDRHSRGAVTPDEADRLQGQALDEELQAAEEALRQITLGKQQRLGMAAVVSGWFSKNERDNGIEIVRNTNPLVGNDGEEWIEERGGIRCCVRRGTDTMLMARPEGSREFTEYEARALVGEMVSNAWGEPGKVSGYTELQRPDATWAYGVEVDWSRHGSRDGGSSEEYFGDFTDGQNSVQLLGGAASRQARREWDKQAAMSDEEWVSRANSRDEKTVARFTAKLDALRGLGRSNGCKL